ncbi:lytic transglycosylase domain-containing protein [Gammaproteobacteria bacterium AB-CW1]|uniref:Lytic transglycosylase domain-containing protein n=1 Tax=Natronospira elongata TaxID=3110268 RepID=A0AAP6MLY3_9GAMM|nr:lytic transglycosylase domain-containing protein [Gammaproteobacteria bacterium AB-CW1]
MSSVRSFWYDHKAQPQAEASSVPGQDEVGAPHWETTARARREGSDAGARSDAGPVRRVRRSPRAWPWLALGLVLAAVLLPLDRQDRGSCLGQIAGEQYYLPDFSACGDAVVDAWIELAPHIHARTESLSRQGLRMGREAGEGLRRIVSADAQARPLPRLNPGSAEDWLGMVDAMADRFELDPGLLLAVMETESAFDPHAVSHAGARGLMQILPEGAEADAREQLRLDARDDLFDPAINMLIGSWYLSSLLERYRDRVPSEVAYGLALAAYNWGPGRVDRLLLTDYPPQDLATFAERLDRRAPAETRQYVRRIAGRIDHWQSWYESQ